MRFPCFLLLLLAFPPSLMALPGGSPVCDVFADFRNVSGMQNRPRVQSPGPYVLESDVPDYAPFEVVEITLTGAAFIGLMFTVVDEQGNKVGTFSSDSQVRGCDGEAMSVTHSEVIGQNSKTLFWIPPAEQVGTVYVMGYILEGESGTGSAQRFYRFVRDDGSALAIEPRVERLFGDSFEQ